MGIGSVVVALACAASAQAATINVKPKPDALEKAIDKAKKGDTLKVKGGVYREVVACHEAAQDRRREGRPPDDHRSAATWAS